MATILIRRGTAAQWASADPTLAAGEPGFETDTGRGKVGDGATAWTGLPHAMTPTVTLTQAAYDALDPPDPYTLYLVVG